MLALIVGLIEIGLGIGKLGFVADLLSSEVQVGYMNGLTITIIVGQLPKLLCLRVENHQHALGGKHGKNGDLMKYTYAEVVKLVDTHVSGACGASCAGSSPAFGTKSHACEDAKRRVLAGLVSLLFFFFQPLHLRLKGEHRMCQVIQRYGIVLKIRKLI